MAEKQLENLTIEGARIMFRNFAGREQTFNSEGDRNFCVFLDPGPAEQLKKEGWNIKQLRPREEDGDVGQHYVQVSVNYKKGRPPRVVLVSSKGRTDLGADEVEILDFAELKNVDIILNPYAWEIKKGDNVDRGIKAYLKTGFFTINEDELELKYSEDPTNQTPAMSSTASDD